MTGQMFAAGRALTPEDCAEPERSQEYTDALGTSLGIYYKLQNLADTLEWEIECTKRGVMSATRKQMRGNVGFAGDVHLIEVMDAVIELKATIISRKAELERVRTFDPTQAWAVVNLIGMEFLDDSGNPR